MKPFGELISLEEAQQIIDKHVTPLTRTESVFIDQAWGVYPPNI